MESTLIQLLFVLIVLLAVLIFFLLQSSRKKKQKTQDKQNLKQVHVPSLLELRDQLKKKDLNALEIKKIVGVIVTEYGEIEDFEIYLDIIFRVARHPNMTKDILLGFEKDLSRVNPSFSSSISKAVSDGVNSRGT